MDASATWGLVGVILGAVLAGVIDRYRDRALVDERNQARARDAAKVARDERKLAYVQLLVAARQLRYAARDDTTITPERVEEVKTDLSSAFYIIEILSDETIKILGDAVRRQVLNYVNTPNNERRLAARKAVEAFTEAAKLDIEVPPPITEMSSSTWSDRWHAIGNSLRTPKSQPRTR